MGEPLIMQRVGLVAALLAPLLFPDGAAALGEGGVACTVRVIQALPEGSEFDQRLTPLRPQLTKPPLSSWKAFRLLMQHELQIKGDQPTSFKVPGEHEGTLAFLGHVEGSKRRMRMRMEMKDGSAKLLSTVFVINDGGTVLEAGMRHGGGVLVLGVTCRSEKR